MKRKDEENTSKIFFLSCFLVETTEKQVEQLLSTHGWGCQVKCGASSYIWTPDKYQLILYLLFFLLTKSANVITHPFSFRTGEIKAPSEVGGYWSKKQSFQMVFAMHALQSADTTRVHLSYKVFCLLLPKLVIWDYSVTNLRTWETGAREMSQVPVRT